MKTKQVKEEPDKSLEEDVVSEPKTRARKKASDTNEEEKSKTSQDEPKTPKEPKKTLTKPKPVVKKRPLGIRKTLRSKKVVVVAKDKIKNVIKQGAKRGRKPAAKPQSAVPEEKDAVPLIPASEIKKEPVDEPTSNSRSSSPKTAGRRQRLSSDMIMMKSVLGDSPTSLVHGTRTSPYPMRSERSNSPSLVPEVKNLRSGKPRKVKSNLLNEVVMKEQKKRRRLLSDSKVADSPEGVEEKKLKRGRSCSRDGSEISKCSDVTDTDISLSETLSNDADTSKELNKKLDKTKTDLDVDIENNLQISTTEKVPSLNVDSTAETRADEESASLLNVKNKKKLSLKRSTSIDSDNNNSSNRLIETLNNSMDAEEKCNLLIRTENDTLLNDRNSILTSMSKTFNSKEVSKNIRKARRGRKAANMPRAAASKPATTSSVTNDSSKEDDDKHETIDTLSKEIDDLISNLDQALDNENQMEADTETKLDTSQTDPMTKSVSKFYGLSKPLCDNNSILSCPETPTKVDKEVSGPECTPSKNDDSENIRLHYDEDSAEKSGEVTQREITYKCSSVASIDKLMDRLKEFEEFDKKRQRQESESKSGDNKQVMVTNDVVLIPKSGADIKPLKDIQSVRSPEKPMEKENLLSCFENNSAISIVKREPARKSVDIDLPNSVTLIKRNSISRKESTGSNHSRESNDAISIFEKSFGKDVTLTEIRKSVDKSSPTAQVDIHQLATLHPNTPSQTLAGVVLDSKQISITPRILGESKPTFHVVTKRLSVDSTSRKSSETPDVPDDKMATIQKIKAPVPSPSILSPVPVAIKSPESLSMDTEPLAPPLDNIKSIPESISLPSKVDNAETKSKLDLEEKSNLKEKTALATEIKFPTVSKINIPTVTEIKIPTVTEIKIPTVTEIRIPTVTEVKIPTVTEVKIPTVTEVKIPTVTEVIIPKVTEVIIPKVTEVIIPTVTEIAVPCATKIPEKMSITEEPVKPEEKPIVSEKLPIVLDKLPEVTAEVKEQTENDSKISETAEVAKPGKSPEKVKSIRVSIENKPGPSNILLETPESQKRKENVLRTLGLLTHKAANEAKIEKAKEKERLYGINAKKAKSGDYTGTLKTVIKLNRGDRKKYRSSLKMTFQKSKHRGKLSIEQGEAADNDDAYYTIERREGGAVTTEGGHRKSYSNRLNNHEEAATELIAEPANEAILNLVIPEKASSFSIHPGRLCMDQCFYCGGKFGLFDTPCHIAQMKSSERQRKVLANEEKLTIDSCLCDACYRHVDRRANCPSYRKRPLVKQATTLPQTQLQQQQQAEKPLSPPLEEESEEEPPTPGLVAGRAALCHTTGCIAAATNCIRRKWLIKMRNSVNKVLKLEGDYPGLHTIPLCADHYRALAPLMACVLCRRRLTKHHNVHFIHHGYAELNPLLKEASIPVEFTERPVLCKPCRLYCMLLQRPGAVDPDTKSYRRRLLNIHNIEVPPESEPETEDTTVQDDSSNTSFNKQKKKNKNKNKQRKSTDPDKPGEVGDNIERKLSESSHDSEKIKEENSNDSTKQSQPMEEDIESLISSNKIMVSRSGEPSGQSDGSEGESMVELNPLLPLDKQTELQYLLQKQNNPAQFMAKPGANLTQKQKNIMKLQTASGITKPSLHQRINDKNAQKIHKLGQIMTLKEKTDKPEDNMDASDPDRSKESVNMLKNIPLNDECTIESIPNKKPADINTLKNKWQMSESFTQVQKNLSQLSKKITIDKSTKKLSDLKYSNPVKRLETNPSISVRELFPGEEEMNLQCNVEFNQVKGHTPEGWEKCNSTIQYDVETKKLWTELQRPYGNQSSFLRHLVLLEKYFRSGDLVLSHNATPHAANYSDSVQSRLRAYDNVVTDAPRRSEPSISLIEFRKQKPLSQVNGKSLLKTNQEKEAKRNFMPPPGSLPKPAKSKDKSKSKPLPPELIAINTPNAQGRKAIQNVLHNIQQLVKGVTASDPTEVAAAPLPQPPPKFDPPKYEPPKFEPPKFDLQKPLDPPKFDPPPVKEKKEAKSDTPKKQKTTSKPWRPTLMPITPENLKKIANEPPQTAVDGRSLPSLVQVMSSGKRYHITLQDYNKMCIMRREKLQQIQDGDKKRPSTDPETVITEIQPSNMLGNGGTIRQSIVTEKTENDRPKTEAECQMGNAATILKNVGLKNITIAPIPAKTATVTSQILTAPTVSSPSLLVTSTPIKMPQYGVFNQSSVTITSETVLTASIPATTSVSQMIMPKIPKSLTVIPQTVMPQVGMIIPSVPQSMGPSITTMVPTQAVITPAVDGQRP